MIDSFSVSPEVMDVVRKKIESHFIPMRISKSVEELGFENIYFLKDFELEELFCDLGLTEMATAFLKTSPKVMRVIYNRLSVKDAKKLQGRIRTLSDVTQDVYSQARSNMLRIDDESIGPKRLLKNLGLTVFAEAVDDSCGKLVRMIKQKLDPKAGYLLRRFVNERKTVPSAVSCKKRQDAILKTIAFLADVGRVDSDWKRFCTGGILQHDEGEGRNVGGLSATGVQHRLA